MRMEDEEESQPKQGDDSEEEGKDELDVELGAASVLDQK